MNDVYVYLFDDLDSLPKDYAIKNLHRLPAFRQEQCAKYKHEIDKNNCLLAYLLLEKGLKEQFGITAPVSFFYNKHGKPYLREYPHIFFNISHCKKGVVCALSEVEIGVDIQDIGAFDWKVAHRSFSKNELQALKKSDNPELMFCKIWTRKEAFAKLNGDSVANVLRLNTINAEFRAWENEHCCISISAEVKFTIMLRKTGESR